VVGLFILTKQQSPKRAMLKGNADQWDEPKGNNRKEDYKP
jgi:hypothetical protein